MMEIVGQESHQSQQRDHREQNNGTTCNPAPGPGIFQNKAGQSGGTGQPPWLPDIEPEDLRLKINREKFNDLSPEKKHAE